MAKAAGEQRTPRPTATAPAVDSTLSGALCRRADGFPWRLGCRVGREEEGEDDQGEGGAEETLGELGHCDLLGRTAPATTAGEGGPLRGRVRRGG